MKKGKLKPTTAISSAARMKLLLDISHSITTIKGKNELWKVMIEKIKPVLKFNASVSTIYSVDYANYCYFLYSESVTKKMPFAFAGLFNVYLPIKNTSDEWVYKQDDICTLTTQEKETIAKANPEAIKILKAAGIEFSLYIKLKIGGKVIGVQHYHFEKKAIVTTEIIALAKSITDLIALAIANILANEEILAREKEKTMLLSVSKDIATIRSSESLFDIMTKRFSSVIQFDEAVILVLDKEKKHYYTLYSTMDNKIDVKSGTGSDHCPVTSSMTQMITSGDFMICDVHQLLKKNEGNKGLIQIQRMGIVEIMGVPLKYANEIIGFLMLYSKTIATYSETNSNFIVSVTNQLSVAISNIVAYEELKQNAYEIERLNKQLTAQNEYLLEEVEEQYNFDEMIGQNEKFHDACKNIGLVSKTDSTVLILGETGTGKELVARAIHNHSPRKNKPLIKLNCAALPANLIESELFGHERGAFTGAIERRIGKFELANGSTLFLDEVGELPLELQAKLLRALQEKEIERLGSNKTLQIDVRIIAATNRELMKEVQAGKFRQDLYYRLHIFPITLPPLRERREDIPLLASHFIQKYAKKIGKNILGINHKAMQDMVSYNWPGNIRELEHVIERSVILSKTTMIQQLDLPVASKNRITTAPNEFVIKTWEEQERDYILEVLKLTNGNVTGKGGAAELLQLPPTTLQSKMLKLGIKRKHFLDLTQK